MKLAASIFAVGCIAALPLSAQGPTATAPQPSIAFGEVRGFAGDDVFLPVMITPAGMDVRAVTFEVQIPAEVTFDRLEPSLTSRRRGVKLTAMPALPAVRVRIEGAGESPRLDEGLLATLKIHIPESLTTARPFPAPITKIELKDATGVVHALKDAEATVVVQAPESRSMGPCFFYMH